jgi:hypothetical protein
MSRGRLTETAKIPYVEMFVTWVVQGLRRHPKVIGSVISASRLGERMLARRTLLQISSTQ